MNHQELHEAFKKAYEDVILPEDQCISRWNWKYIECLYDLVKIRAPQRILELGVYYGFSTVAMLLAAKEYGGELWSVDLELKKEAVKAVDNLHIGWRAFSMDDLEFVNILKEDFSLIFIDTEHIYDQCRKEINAFHPHLNPDGIMVFHDVSAGQGAEVFRAIKEFMAQHQEYKFTGYNQDIGIIYTQKKVLLESDQCSCGSKVYELGKFGGNETSYKCVKCNSILMLPFGYRATREVR